MSPWSSLISRTDQQSNYYQGNDSEWATRADLKPIVKFIVRMYAILLSALTKWDDFVQDEDTLSVYQPESLSARLRAEANGHRCSGQ
jgi:hypothetical protein